MEINITKFFNESAPMDYSASVAEIGENAGKDTWNAAKEDASDNADLLNTDEKRQEFREYVKSFGAWDKEEIASWNNEELTALFMQMIAGDMREANIGPNSTNEDWKEYEESAENGNVSGRIFKDDNGSIYYSIGN